MQPKYIWMTGAVSLFAVLFMLFASGLGKDPRAMQAQMVGEKFPRLYLVTMAGETVFEPEALKGTPFLVNVWATWCVTCAVEHQVLNRLAQEGVKIVGINYKDNLADAKQWLNQYGNPYTSVILDPNGRAAIELGVHGTPETFVVDSQGIVQHRYAGPVTAEKMLDLTKRLADAS